MMRVRVAVLAALTLVAACGGGDNASSAKHDATVSEMSAETASFDLAANSPQPYSIGLIGPEQESVAYGTIHIEFVFDGPNGQPLAHPRTGPTATASFFPIAGLTIDPNTPGPKLVEPSVARGVYKTEPMTFDTAGFWEANARFTIDGKTRTANAAFEVLDHHQLPFIGDRAPRTTQSLAGEPGVRPVTIDSRAQDGDPIPDPELHDTTIAAALDAHRPLMVVVATPTYCTSRFCGPITDSVARLAPRYRDRMAFVHLEIWDDFSNGKLNPWVNDWIVPRNGEDGREPWVFVVNRDGRIVDRIDNLASDRELADAAEKVIG